MVLSPLSATGKERNKRHDLFKASAYDMYIKKKFETGFNRETLAEFAEILQHRGQAGRSPMFSIQKIRRTIIV